MLTRDGAHRATKGVREVGNEPDSALLEHKYEQTGEDRKE